MSGPRLNLVVQPFLLVNRKNGNESEEPRCLFLRKCTVVPEERIPLFRSKYTVRPEQDTACIILASASLLA